MKRNTRKIKANKKLQKAINNFDKAKTQKQKLLAFAHNLPTKNTSKIITKANRRITTSKNKLKRIVNKSAKNLNIVNYNLLQNAVYKLKQDDNSAKLKDEYIKIKAARKYANIANKLAYEKHLEAELRLAQLKDPNFMKKLGV